jgi:hypothetical protein
MQSIPDGVSGREVLGLPALDTLVEEPLGFGLIRSSWL